jgi:hypothetical protein
MGGHTRKPSFSSVSSVSSLTAMEEDMDDEANSEASSDDEDDHPASCVSYGCEESRGRKAGSNIGSPPPAGKKRKPSYDDGYDAQLSSLGSDSGSSDDGYEAVDDITDADDEEIEVEKLEEQLILE